MHGRALTPPGGRGPSRAPGGGGAAGRASSWRLLRRRGPWLEDAPSAMPLAGVCAAGRASCIVSGLGAPPPLFPSSV